jgi:hypothetical protein
METIKLPRWRECLDKSWADAKLTDVEKCVGSHLPPDLNEKSRALFAAALTEAARIGGEAARRGEEVEFKA